MSSVLIIDDDGDNRDLVSRVLVRAGHAVRCADGYREAMRALVAGTPDCIILDILMPDMDGITLLEVIRSSPRWTFVPVLILTACPEDPRLGPIGALGVTRVFTKSRYDLEDLVRCVDERTVAGAGVSGGVAAG